MQQVGICCIVCLAYLLGYWVGKKEEGANPAEQLGSLIVVLFISAIAIICMLILLVSATFNISLIQ